jgi:hypothetical protein
LVVVVTLGTTAPEAAVAPLRTRPELALGESAGATECVAVSVQRTVQSANPGARSQFTDHMKACFADGRANAVAAASLKVRNRQT